VGGETPGRPANIRVGGVEGGGDGSGDHHRDGTANCNISNHAGRGRE
jgi:hypothetical protein